MSWLLARWLTRFLLSMNRAQAGRAVDGLVALSIASLRAYEELATREQFGFERRGLLMVALTEVGLADCREELEWVAKRGVAGRALTADETRALEPAIIGTGRGALAGAVHFPDEGMAEPLATVKALRADAERAGAKFHEGVEVFGAEAAGGRIRKVLAGVRRSRILPGRNERHGAVAPCKAQSGRISEVPRVARPALLHGVPNPNSAEPALIKESHPIPA